MESLALLYRHRAIGLHELSDSKILRRIARLSQGREDELLDRAHHAHLWRVIAWLDGLPQASPLRKIIVDQRERAVREQWESQKRQLQRTGQPFPNSSGENDIGYDGSTVTGGWRARP